MLEPQDHTISKLTGMFVDRNLEQQYQEGCLDRSKNYLRRIALIIGILFFSFFIYDVLSNSSFQAIGSIFLCRLAFLVLSLFFYFRPDFCLKSFAFLKITIYQLILIIFFFIIVLNHENPHFVVQAFAVNVIILGIFFLIPNLQPHRIFLASLTLAIFLIIAVTAYQPSSLEVISIFVYLSLCIFFSSISSYSLGKYTRLDFVNKQYFLELSMKDPLTNTYNRLKFNESLSRELGLAKRYGHPFSLLMFDIDHFKQLNDKNGHVFGDKVLIELADLVKRTVREFDVFARWGGEEFVILLPQTDCKEAAAIAERLRRLICRESLKKEMTLTCSFGVTSFSSQDDEDSIMNRVDRALYKAKESGRNVVVTEEALQAISV